MESKAKYRRQPIVAYTERNTTFVDKEFQIKYTRYTLWLATISAIIFLLPTLYFINQNYDIFLRLSDLFNPELANYLSGERFGLNFMFGVIFISNIIFWSIFSRKMTAKIAGPAKIMRNHIRLLSRGNFSLPPVTLREDDEFKDLVSTYNYFYSLLRVQNENEITNLKKIRTLLSNPEAKDLVSEMIDERENRVS